MHHDPRRSHYTSCWSVSEHSHHMNSVAFEGTIKLVYTLTGPRVLESTVNYLKRVAEKGGTYAILDRPTFEALAKVAPAYVDYTPDDAFLGKPFLGKFNGLAILEPPTGA